MARRRGKNSETTPGDAALMNGSAAVPLAAVPQYSCDNPPFGSYLWYNCTPRELPLNGLGVLQGRRQRPSAGRPNSILDPRGPANVAHLESGPA